MEVKTISISKENDQILLDRMWCGAEETSIYFLRHGCRKMAAVAAFLIGTDPPSMRVPLSACGFNLE